MDCRKFVERGCLSFTVASLSSRDVHVRQAGYHVLSRYMMHLEGARFKERKQVSAVGHSIMRERTTVSKTDRQAVRQTDTDIGRWSDRQTDMDCETDTDRQ